MIRDHLFSSVSVLSLSLLTIVSCGSYQDERGRYVVEQAFYEAEKQMETYSVKPELRTAADFAFLVDGYREVYRQMMKEFPDLSSQDSLNEAEGQAAFLAGRSLITAAGIFASGELPDSSEALLRIVLDNSYFNAGHRNDARFLLARIAEGQGRWADAEEHYLALIDSFYPPATKDLAPARDVLEIPRNVAMHYAREGDEEMARAKVNWAIDYYQKIIDTFPKSPLTLISTGLLADMFNAKGEFQKSVDLLQTVVDSTGRVAPTARLLTAELYYTRLDRKADAIRLYHELIADPEDSLVKPSAYLKLTNIAIKEKRYSDARKYVADLKAGFSKLPGYMAEGQQLLAASFEEEGEWDRALQEYQYLLSQYPRSTQALQILVYLPEFCRKFGQPTLAEQWALKAEEKLKGFSQDFRGRDFGLMTLNLYCGLLLRQGKVDEAIAQLDQLRKDYPKSVQASEALLRVARIYRDQKNDPQRAIEAYREYLKLYPNSVVRSKVEAEISRLERG